MIVQHPMNAAIAKYAMSAAIAQYAMSTALAGVLIAYCAIVGVR